MGSDLSKLFNTCLNRDSECSADCPNCEIIGCCECDNGSINIISHISEDEEETENEEPTPNKRRSSVRRSSEN